MIDSKTNTIIHTHYFEEAKSIYDILKLDDNNYMIAAEKGLLKITNNSIINHYYKGEDVRCLC